MTIGIVRERVQMPGIPERIAALNSLVGSEFEPQPPAWQASALPIGLCPTGELKYSLSKSNTFCCTSEPLASTGCVLPTIKLCIVLSLSSARSINSATPELRFKPWATWCEVWAPPTSPILYYKKLIYKRESNSYPRDEKDSVWPLRRHIHQN